MAKVTEFMLHKRLESIRGNPEHCEALQSLDEHGLLGAVESIQPEPEVKPLQAEDISSIDDILSDDALGLLDDGADSIFTIKHVPKTIDMPEKIAKRKKCKDFDQYKPLFVACHKALKSGEKEQHKFSGEQQIQKGQFFILHGVMCYVADMEERVKKNGKVNAKLYLIFENGTESNMLLRSLATELYKDETGRRIMSKSEDGLDEMLGIKDDDTATGFIYILRSLSQKPEIKSIQNLYKIGYSTTPVETRLANAENEPTYLMDKVYIEAEFKCFNMNTQKFENFLHTFLADARVDLEVADSNGEICKPREWFVVPMNVIETAITLIINGEIVHYRYDRVIEKIVKRQNHH